jgi:hypothetical protein
MFSTSYLFFKINNSSKSSRLWQLNIKSKNAPLLSGEKSSFYCNELHFFWITFLILLQEAAAFGSMRLYNKY